MTCFTFQPTLEAYSFAPTTVAQAQATEEVKTSARRIELKPATAPRRVQVKSATSTEPAVSPSVPSEVKTTTQVKQENLQKPRTVKQCWLLHSFTGCYIPEEMTREDASFIIDGIMATKKKYPEGGKVEDPLAKYCAGKYLELSDWVAHGCCVAPTKEKRWEMEGRTTPPEDPKPAAKPRRVKKTTMSEEQLRMFVLRNAMVADKEHLEAAYAALTK